MRKYPIGLTTLVGTLGGITVGLLSFGVVGAVLYGLFGFAVGSHIDIDEYYNKGRWRK